MLTPSSRFRRAALGLHIVYPATFVALVEQLVYELRVDKPGILLPYVGYLKFAVAMVPYESRIWLRLWRRRNP